VKILLIVIAALLTVLGLAYLLEKMFAE